MKNSILRFITSLLFAIFAGALIASVAALPILPVVALFGVGAVLTTAPQGSLAALGSAGDLSSGDLVAVLGVAEKLWADSQLRADYSGMVDGLKAIMQNQTAQFPELQDPLKDNTVKIAWSAHCGDAVADVTDDCTLNGTEVQTDAQTMTLNLNKHSGFSIKEKALRATIFSQEELIAKGMLASMKKLDEYLAATVIAQLNTWAGTNAYEDGLAGGAGFDEINSANWDHSLMSEFMLISRLNKFQSPYLLSGVNLFKAQMNAAFNAGNANEKDQMQRFNSLPVFFDLFNVDTVNTPDKLTYLIDRGACAFVSKTYYGDSPVEYIGAGQKRYRVASKNLEGVYYDVVYTNDCTSNEITHKWDVSVNAGFYLNPTACDANRTGVLAFKNVSS